MIKNVLILCGLVAFFASCQKNNSDMSFYKAHDLSSFIEKAKVSMSKIVAKNEMDDLDWDNAKAHVQRENMAAVEVKVLGIKDKNRELIFLFMDDMKIYKWMSEVHMIYE